MSGQAGDVCVKVSATERVGPHNLEGGTCGGSWLEEWVTCICGTCVWCLLTGGGI